MTAPKGAGGGPTPGPFLREGSFVYALHEHHLPSGKVVQVNRIYANVTAGAGVPSEEAEAAAALFAAAPELLEALRQAHAQMAMAAECIEAKRYDEALLHVSAMCGHRERAIAKAGGES